MQSFSSRILCKGGPIAPPQDPLLSAGERLLAIDRSDWRKVLLVLPWKRFAAVVTSCMSIVSSASFAIWRVNSHFGCRTVFFLSESHWHILSRRPLLRVQHCLLLLLTGFCQDNTIFLNLRSISDRESATLSNIGTKTDVWLKVFIV